MSVGGLSSLDESQYPRTYRGKYIQTFFVYLVFSGVVYLWAWPFDKNIIDIFEVFLIITIVHITASRTVIYADRIESIDLFNRRILRRDEVARLEVREVRVRRGVVKTRYLIPKNETAKPLPLPDVVEMDGPWVNWMAGIPTAEIPPAGSVAQVVLGMMSFGIVWVFMRSAWPHVIAADAPLLVEIALMASALVAAGLRLGLVKTCDFKRDTVLSWLVGAALSGYVGAVIVNGRADTSTPDFVPVSIARKYETNGRGGVRHHFDLMPWGPETESRVYDVSPSTYDRLRLSDTVCAELHVGAIGIRWYRLRDDCPQIMSTQLQKN